MSIDYSPRPTIQDSLTVRTTADRGDYLAAFRLLQSRYRDAGLSQTEATGLRILPFQLWETTQLIVAKDDHAVVGCVSVVQDSDARGLPMEALYPEELRGLRRRRVPVGEITSLAVNRHESAFDNKVFQRLAGAMVAYARRQGIRFLAAVVHPRHAKLYHRCLGFDVLGGLRRCHHVDGNPGVAIIGDLSDPGRIRPRWRQIYFDGDPADDGHSRRPMSGETRIFLRALLTSDDTNSKRRIG